MAHELRRLVNEYNTLCKTWNVTGLAVSALVKKLAIIELQDETVSSSIREFVRTELELRFQKLFAELVACQHQLIDPSLNLKLEMALLQVHTALEAAEEVDESELLMYETGLEVSSEIESLARLNVVELVNMVRADTQRHRRKLVDLSTFLESQLEAKLHRSVILIQQ